MKTNLRSRYNEGSIKNHSFEEPRVSEDSSDSNHASHAMTNQKQRQVGILVLKNSIQPQRHERKFQDHSLTEEVCFTIDTDLQS